MLQEMKVRTVQMKGIERKEIFHLENQDPIQSQDQKVRKQKGAQVLRLAKEKQKTQFKKEEPLPSLQNMMMIID